MSISLSVKIDLFESSMLKFNYVIRFMNSLYYFLRVPIQINKRIAFEILNYNLLTRIKTNIEYISSYLRTNS